MVGVTQALLGFLFVAAWLAVEPLHPGFGLMIMLGFQQGPGRRCRSVGRGRPRA